MIYDISYMRGPDATQAVRLSEKTDSGSYVILRAARAARLGARAGRLSRVVKVLRFLNPQADEGDADQVQVAKVISSKLQDALSMRVAFLTICVAVVLPIFKMFEYPEMDDPLEATSRTWSPEGATRAASSCSWRRQRSRFAWPASTRSTSRSAQR